MSTGRWETLMARDGHEFAAYLARTAGTPRGAVVVLQEIFGVNAHIRAVVEQYAAAGFLAIAPALFDRIGRNIELGYEPKDMEQGTGYRLQVDEAKALLDIGAAVNVVRHAGRVALVGYCWGGQLTWIGAAALPVQAAVGYYTSRIWEKLDRVPDLPDHAALWRAGPEYSARAHRAAARQASERAHLALCCRPWLQLRRACQLRRAQCRPRLGAQPGFSQTAYRLERS